jgi:hypothetical protein
VGDPVFANSNEIASKSMGGKTICNLPDVCFTPPQTPATPPGVPIPYPNTGMCSDTSEGSRTVKIGGEETMLKNRSAFKQSTGDEAGAAPKKGVVSSKTKGKVYFVAWSMDVKIEGENVVRHLDMTTHNHGTVANAAKPQPCTATIAAASVATQKKCKRPAKDKGKRFVVYIAAVYDSDGNATGQWYVGRTRGPAGATTNAILKKRKSTHHRKDIGPLTAVCETDSYAAVRGAEEKHQKAMAAAGIGAKQDNPLSPRKNVKKKNDEYLECAKEINGPNCSTCGG